ncbi:MAG: 4Fe-4S binding protein [Chloroflexota bacterium]|nr:4Fe-4S binding protein [Chloroflexota bacterium]
MNASLPLLIIHQYRCIGCGDCVARCPVGALETRNGKATLADPEACTYCTLCEDVCPTEAIALPFLVVFKEQRNEAA